MPLLHMGHNYDSDAVVTWNVRDKPALTPKFFRQTLSAALLRKATMLSVGSMASLKPASLSPSAISRVVFMHLSTIFLNPSMPRSLKTAQAEAAEAPVRVPTKVYWKLSVKYGVSVLRESKALRL